MSEPSDDDLFALCGVEAPKVEPKLKEVDPAVLPAAWSVLRW